MKRNPTLRVPRSGRGKLLTGGRPGNKGGTGRPRDEWKERLRGIVSKDEIIAELETVLKDSRHPAYIGALKYATEHGYGRATETIQHTGADGAPIAAQVWIIGDRKVTF